MFVVTAKFSSFDTAINVKTIDEAKELLQKDSTQVVRKAVRGMLPKSKLATQQLKKLKRN